MLKSKCIVSAALDTLSKFATCLVRHLSLLLTLAAPGIACADYRFNFPEPVTPIARKTLHIHNEYMLIITALFVVVFAIMIYSMIRHRKSSSQPLARLTGPASALQWFWVLIPFAILLFINFVLMGIPAVLAITNLEDSQPRADRVLKVASMQWKWQYEYPEAGVKLISPQATPRQPINNTEARGEHDRLEVDQPVVLPVGKQACILPTSNAALPPAGLPGYRAAPCWQFISSGC